MFVEKSIVEIPILNMLKVIDEVSNITEVDFDYLPLLDTHIFIFIFVGSTSGSWVLSLTDSPVIHAITPYGHIFVFLNRIVITVFLGCREFDAFVRALLC